MPAYLALSESPATPLDKLQFRAIAASQRREGAPFTVGLLCTTTP